MTIFWDVSKWNKGQTNWDRGSIYIYIYAFHNILALHNMDLLYN